MLPFFSVIAVIQLAFAPKYFSFILIASFAVLLRFEFAYITVNSADTVICHINTPVKNFNLPLLDYTTDLPVSQPRKSVYHNLFFTIDIALTVWYNILGTMSGIGKNRTSERIYGRDAEVILI